MAIVRVSRIQQLAATAVSPKPINGTVCDDPESVLRRHLSETRRLADRLLRFEESLTIATESGFLDHPQAAIKALREIESTRYSVAGDIRETAIALDRIILDRYRADYPEPSKDRLRLIDGEPER